MHFRKWNKINTIASASPFTIYWTYSQQINYNWTVAVIIYAYKLAQSKNVYDTQLNPPHADNNSVISPSLWNLTPTTIYEAFICIDYKIKHSILYYGVLWIN